MKGARVALRMVLIVLIGFVIGLSVYSWNARRLVGNRMPMPFGVGASVVLSGSMEPTLSVDDLVFVRSADRYAVGDIVVYQTPYDLVIHRIIEIDGETVVTQGDTNNTPDEPIALSQIKGKLALTVPRVGWIVRGLKSLPGVIITLALAAFLLHLSWSREKAEKEDRLDAIKAEIEALKNGTDAPAAAQEQTDPQDAKKK